MTTPRPRGPDDRASVAKQANGHIRALARALQDDRQIGFFCECGCMGLAFATIAEYDTAGGVWREGHKPE